MEKSISKSEVKFKYSGYLLKELPFLRKKQIEAIKVDLLGV